MKIGIIGAGNIGANVAYGLICSEFSDKISQIALVDIIENLAIGKALDLSHASAVFEKDIKVIGGSDYAILSGYDIVVITAGQTRKAGQSREDLLKINAEIVAEISAKIANIAPNSVIILVTNPLDFMVYTAYKSSGFPKNRVIGMAGELDSARLKCEISNLKNEKISQIKASVVGFHNDKMEILKDEIFIDNNKVEFGDKEFDEISQNTKNCGPKIVNLLGTSAFLAPASGIVKIIKQIITEENKTLICSVIDDSEVPCGRFVKLGKFGVKEIVKFNYSQNFTQNFAYFKEKIKNIEIKTQNKETK